MPVRQTLIFRLPGLFRTQTLPQLMKDPDRIPLHHYFTCNIRKRDGCLVPFKPEKIAEAIFKALKVTGLNDQQLAAMLAIKVVGRLDVENATPTFSICQEHSYLYGEHFTCPRCADEGKEQACQVFSRIVGYLRPVEQWNDGKQQEFAARKTFESKL